MKVRTLIRQLAMHDMDAEVWLAWQPPQVTSSMLVTSTSKMSRFGNGKVVYINSKQYAKKWIRNAIEVSPESPKVGCQQQLTQAVDPTMVGTVVHSVNEAGGKLLSNRKFKELSPEVEAVGTKLTVAQAKFALNKAIDKQ